MNSMKIRGGKTPEGKVVAEIMRKLRIEGWYVIKMHGNKFQAGFPDLYACHRDFGIRLIEAKDPKRKGDVFTAAQHEVFKDMEANGHGPWVMTGGSDHEYGKLFKPANWWHYLSTMRI